MNNLIVFSQSLEVVLNAWLDAKSKRSNSAKTLKAYKETIYSFISVLHSRGLGLDSDASMIALVAQAWAGTSTSSIRTEVSPATYNVRLAILSSFYLYAKKTQLYRGDNPIDYVERRKVQAYARAVPLTKEDLEKRLEAIDRSTLQGKRDYALLCLAFSTGRRASELAGLRYGDINLQSEGVTIEWRTKGGKVIRDELGTATATSLFSYLQGAYTNTPLEATSPIWLAFSRNQSKGSAISTHAIADIYSKYLGTSKVHTSRHTFAHEMESIGAKVTEIQARLGHESIATTGQYLKSMGSAVNPYIHTLERHFGITGKTV
jgi:integrase